MSEHVAERDLLSNPLLQDGPAEHSAVPGVEAAPMDEAPVRVAAVAPEGAPEVLADLLQGPHSPQRDALVALAISYLCGS